MPAIKKASLSDQMYEQLRRDIITITIPQGSKLNVNELQAQYEVSSTPIREAINRLQVEGLITYISNVGAHVIALEERDVIEIQDVAMTLHAAAIRFAMNNGDHASIAGEIQENLSSYKKAANLDSLIDSVQSLIGVFYKYSGNARLESCMRVIEGQQLMVRYMFHKHMGADYTNLEAHEGVYQAVVKGDAERIVEIFQETYDYATKVVLQAMRSKDGVREINR